MRGPGQQQASQIITKGDLKERFVQRTFSTYSTLKKAFVDWKLQGKNYFDYPKFKQLMNNWGFVADDTQIKEVYAWMDLDKDGKISFDDLRQTVGLDVSPMEQIYFRQNIRGSKNQPCQYPGCWENTLYNNKSSYCPLHQKVMKNTTIDLFNQIS